MTKRRGFAFMLDFVREYLDGKNSRLDFELDFNHYLIEHYPKMKRESPELTDCFVFYLSEEGQDKAYSLTDAGHKELIQKQFDEFNAAIRDGIL